MVFPILIPSKKRPNSKLFKMLSDDGLDFKVIVEPQDVSSYSQWLDNLIRLPLNDQGLVFSRNFTINYARDNRLDWFWMIDDDITNFYKTINGKNAAVTASVALTKAESLFKGRNDIAQSGLEYQQFSWSQKKPYSFNSYCDVCVCINVKKTKKVNYRENVTLKLDRDFTLQCLALGYKTMRATHVAFSCPKNGSNQGGLYNEYRSGLESKSVKEMCKLWGSDICKPIIKPDGRHDVKINWRYFKQ